MPQGAEKETTITWNRLLDAAESAILEKGFGATSIDEPIAAAGIAKMRILLPLQGFNSGFSSKGALLRGYNSIQNKVGHSIATGGLQVAN